MSTLKALDLKRDDATFLYLLKLPKITFYVQKKLFLF